MPAAWMSSQPTTRRSVSVSVSRPLDMDGVKRSLSSGRRQFSKVMSTPEYSRSPISTPCDPGAALPEPGVPAAAAGAPGPGAPAAAVTAVAAAAAAAILCRRLLFGLLPDRAASRDALRPRPPRPAACHWFDLRAARRRLATIGYEACPSASWLTPEPGVGGGRLVTQGNPRRPGDAAVWALTRKHWLLGAAPGLPLRLHFPHKEPGARDASTAVPRLFGAGVGGRCLADPKGVRGQHAGRDDPPPGRSGRWLFFR